MQIKTHEGIDLRSTKHKNLHKNMGKWFGKPVLKNLFIDPLSESRSRYMPSDKNTITTGRSTSTKLGFLNPDRSTTSKLGFLNQNKITTRHKSITKTVVKHKLRSIRLMNHRRTT